MGSSISFEDSPMGQILDLFQRILIFLCVLTSFIMFTSFDKLKTLLSQAPIMTIYRKFRGEMKEKKSTMKKMAIDSDALKLLKEENELHPSNEESTLPDNTQEKSQKKTRFDEERERRMCEIDRMLQELREMDN